ncbi:transposase [Thermoactinomyces sp. CICC 10523]|uniref:transposase n=1 Tax=Thermoactinomyces sp. CICC 10523 TaxID=2767428 RepID=UPI00351C4552
MVLSMFQTHCHRQGSFKYNVCLIFTYVRKNTNRLTAINCKGSREYNRSQTGRNCPFLSRCPRSKNHVKTVNRHVWKDTEEWVRQHRLSKRGKTLYKQRKETIGRRFADGKELHELRHARMRELARITEQSLLTAMCQNIKKMTLLLFRMSKGPKGAPFFAVRSSLFSSI